MTPKIFISGICLLLSILYLIIGLLETDKIKAEHNYTRFCIYSAALFIITTS